MAVASLSHVQPVLHHTSKTEGSTQHKHGKQNAVSARKHLFGRTKEVEKKTCVKWFTRLQPPSINRKQKVKVVSLRYDQGIGVSKELDTQKFKKI